MSLCNSCKCYVDEDDYIVCDCGLIWCSNNCAKNEGYNRTKKKSSCRECRQNKIDKIGDHFLFNKKPK